MTRQKGRFEFMAKTSTSLSEAFYGENQIFICRGSLKLVREISNAVVVG